MHEIDSRCMPQRPAVIITYKMKPRALRAIIIILTCLSLAAIVLALWPGMTPVSMCAGLAVAAAMILIARARCPWYGGVAAMVTAFAATLSLAAVALNINYFTVASGGTLADPVFHNYDAMRDWAWACNIAWGDPLPDYIYYFAPQGRAYAWLMLIFGRSIAVPLVFISLCYTATVIMTGAVTWRLTASKRAATVAVAMCALMCYLLAHSAVLLKDCPVTLAWALMAWFMAAMCRNSRLGVADWAAIVMAAFLLMLFRPNGLLMFIVPFVLMLPAMPRRRRVIIPALIVAAVALRYVSSSADIVKSIAFTTMSDDTTAMVLSNQYTAPLDRLTGNYTALPFYIKLLWLPVTVGLLFLLPFPWNFGRDMIFGPAEAVAHFGFFWYFAGLLVVFYLFSRKRPAGIPLFWMTTAGVALYIFIAYVTGGRVSRYCLPLLPLLLPAAATTLSGSYRRPALWRWIGCSGACIAAALVLAHNLQSAS